MAFQKLLDKYRKISFSERDKGDRFERLMQAYLLTDPKYTSKLKKVWLWSEFHGKNDLGGGDTGIDLVALTVDGDYWAIQCKCFQESSVIDKPAVDSFLSTSSREFKNEKLKTVSFSHRLWISTTNKWGPNATEAIKNQNPPVTRINLFDLQEAPVDWEKLDKGIHGEASRNAKKSLRPHQKEALDKTHTHFKNAERGKLIMACGTGKTFNSLRIAENETKGKGLVLFLVPSIALLGQTLREWSSDANEPINAICICSDPEISRKKTKNDDSDSFSVVDLALPASTDTKDIISQFKHIKASGNKGLTVVFSTYQSVEVIARAQKEIIKNGFGEFDLIICDEAHRTTGVSLAGEDESAFTKVHDNKFIKAKKRLYMTATPRLYSDDTKSKAAQADAILCSMDDPKLYGEEIYRIGFGEAVERDLLTDYKVLILTLSDKDVPPAVQKMIADEENEINADDASKLIGCINALSKQILGDEGVIKASDPEPMQRAVAFCSSIAGSKKITATYNTATDAYLSSLPAEKKEQMVSVASQHIDGTMSAPQRDELLGWLKADIENNECRILTNVRCLSEGVDVPSLDAVMFLSARNSQVDVVQSVGRVMRKSPGKKYGYIIIPVVVPANVEADKALDDNERYKVVWTVLNALRAHDDRFNATVNKIELNRKRPQQILVGRPEYSFDSDGMPSMVAEDRATYGNAKDINQQMALQFEQLQNVVFARMVQKVGDRKYWEQWAKDVAIIAERQIERIQFLITEKKDQRTAFEKFLLGLQKNINPSISEAQAVEMLAQHIITKPVFEALFEGYSFVKHNAVSVSMQRMLDELEPQTLVDESESLQKFYAFVKRNASGVDNAKGKQEIIIRLYDNFFKAAFPKMVEQLGIVYTPVEVVDFIIHSVDDVLKKEFYRSLSDENIHILDPFTGTGTFMTRLLQSGLITTKDLARKYQNELHANEIVLLAYYIAAVNIENAYHDLRNDGKEYEPFEGIVLTDTFQLGESDDNQKLFSDMFPQNSARAVRQKKAPLRVIIGNPPYSVGQKSENDDAKNLSYERLDSKITTTYALETSASSLRSLYDPYFRAFRWATDRLPKEGGVVAFITNSAWVYKSTYDGFRKSLSKEFSTIYVLDLKGAIKGKSGEIAKKEGGNVFDIMTGVAITILIKNNQESKTCKIRYGSVEGYLSRNKKLAFLSGTKSILSKNIVWQEITPNKEGDWIEQRTNTFEAFIPLYPDKKFNTNSKSFFLINSLGTNSNRDSWVYGSNLSLISQNLSRSIQFYNKQVEEFKTAKLTDSNINAQKFIDRDSTKISWSSSIIPLLEKGNKIAFEKQKFTDALYRPFFAQKLYNGEKMIHRRGQSDDVFVKNTFSNKVIAVTGVGDRKGFSCLMTDKIPDIQVIENSQYFPLNYYEKSDKNSPSLFPSGGENEYIERSGISNFILEEARKVYGKKLEKEDIFYYVYGFLHSPEYREMFTNDLKKMLPRLPLVEDVKDFWAFSKAGRALAELHVNYETVPASKDAKVSGEDSGFYTVEKMRFPKKDQKDTILYNSKITISNIPLKAYEYVVNGKSAIEWIMERYQVTTHKESGIKNDPNDWSKEVGNARYILDLLLSIINVSVQTLDIVDGLPKVKFE
jgi:predicted helicase